MDNIMTLGIVNEDYKDFSDFLTFIKLCIISVMSLLILIPLSKAFSMVINQTVTDTDKIYSNGHFFFSTILLLLGIAIICTFLIILGYFIFNTNLDLECKEIIGFVDFGMQLISYFLIAYLITSYYSSIIVRNKLKAILHTFIFLLVFHVVIIKISKSNKFQTLSILLVTFINAITLFCFFNSHKMQIIFIYLFLSMTNIFVNLLIKIILSSKDKNYYEKHKELLALAVLLLLVLLFTTGVFTITNTLNCITPSFKEINKVRIKSLLKIISPFQV